METYQIVSVDNNILKQLQKEVDENQHLIDNCLVNQITVKHFIWVESLTIIIQSIDAKSTDPFFEKGLMNNWHEAKYRPYVTKNGRNESKIQEARSFASYISIITSILKTKKAKVVKEYIKKSSSLCIFHKRDLQLQENLVFVLMPFTESWSDYIWQEQIKPIVENIEQHGLICRRANDLFGHDVMQDIYESILTANIVIADITNQNANVFYELGLAHSLNKNIILLSQGVEHIPFDLNRFRHCIYSNDGPGYKTLKDYIPKAINDIISEGKRSNV